MNGGGSSRSLGQQMAEAFPPGHDAANRTVFPAYLRALLTEAEQRGREIAERDMRLPRTINEQMAEAFPPGCDTFNRMVSPNLVRSLLNEAEKRGKLMSLVCAFGQNNAEKQGG